MEQIRVVSPSQAVFDQLSDNILNGIWRPGEKIPSEPVIMRSTGASRAAVRDAVKRLEGMGLVVVKRGDGSYVSKIDPETYLRGIAPVLRMQDLDYQSLQEYRYLTEPQIAYMAAKRATEEEIRQLEQIITVQRREVENTGVYIEKDLEFHHLLASCTKNKALMAVHETVSGVLDYAIKQAIVVHDKHGVEFHEKIIEAIRARDAKLAEQRMKEHILYNLEVEEKKDLL